MENTIKSSWKGSCSSCGNILFEGEHESPNPQITAQKWLCMKCNYTGPLTVNVKLAEEVNTPDKINSPDHYTVGGIETIDYIEAKLTYEGILGFCVGNVMKYISRARHKNGLEDLKKAQWYLNRAIATVEKYSADNV